MAEATGALGFVAVVDLVAAVLAGLVVVCALEASVAPARIKARKIDRFIREEAPESNYLKVYQCEC